MELLDEVLLLLRKERQAVGYPEKVSVIKYSELLQKKVVQLLLSGMKRMDVTKVTGISDASLYRWTVTYKNIPVVKQLEIVSEPDVIINSQQSNINSNIIVLTLPSGLVIKVPRLEFDKSFLTVVDSVAGGYR